MTQFTVLDICNYYGSLEIKEEDGKYFWAIENWDGYDWKEIPKYLYDSLKTFQEQNK